MNKKILKKIFIVAVFCVFAFAGQAEKVLAVDENKILRNNWDLVYVDNEELISRDYRG